MYVPNIYGLPVYYDSDLVDRVQVRFPRSKKRRIRRKWAKQSCNFRHVPQTTIYVARDFIILHPAMADRLRDRLEEENRKRNVALGDCVGSPE